MADFQTIVYTKYLTLPIFILLSPLPFPPFPLLQRCLLVLSLPEDRHNPPALAVVHQLDAVDATLKRLGVVWRVSRFIGAKDVRDLTKLFSLARGLSFVKTFFLRKATSALDILVNRQDA